MNSERDVINKYVNWVGSEKMDEKQRKMTAFINSIKSRLNLKDPTIEKAKEIYSEVIKKDLLAGKKFNFNTQAAAILFIATNLSNFPKPSSEILKATQTTLKAMSQCFKMI